MIATFVPVSFDIARSGFSVRRATAADAKACRMLLPGFALEASWLVAVDGERQLVVGAAAAAHAMRPTPLVGPGVLVHVIEPCRGQGIGRELVGHLTELARGRGAKALYGASRVDADGEAMAAWRGLGFDVCETVEEHVLPVAALIDRLAPLVERMRREGRIPAEARIVPLYAATPAAVMELHLDNMGGDRGALYQKILGQGPGAFHRRYSRVLMLGDRVMGCILAHRKDADTAIVDATIVARELRGGWANVWLKLEATLGARSLGITRFEFSSFDAYEDTRRFTAKLGGVVTRRRALVWRRTGEAAGR